MRHALSLQSTNIRSALVDGKDQIELQLVSKDEVGQEHKTEWVHMPPEDARALVAKIVLALDELPRSA